MKVYAVYDSVVDKVSDRDIADSYILGSFMGSGRNRLPLVFSKCKESILDSGAFTFLANNRAGQSINWEEYIESYASFVKKSRADHYIELDIDPIVGYDQVKRLRKILEEKTGKQAIRVWHKSRGKEEFLKDIQECDYVALGGIVTREWKQNEYPFMSWFINEAHKNGTKIHGLGFTRQKYFSTLRFDSVDSSSYLCGRFGSISYFNGRDFVTERPEGVRMKKAINNSEFSYREFIKFQRYCEDKY